jgi:site-specific DNA-methyltransferase (adenine-specific)
VKPYYESDGITIYHGDCREVIPTLGRVVATITDPPYGCGKAEWDETFPTEWYSLCAAISDRIVIITGSAGLKDTIPLVGADFVDVIAARNMNGMTRGPIGFGNWLAAVVAKGKPSQGINCFDFTVQSLMPNHPSPKPLPYMVRLIGRVTKESDSILDPFMGSGTTLRAAKDLGRRAIGIEIEERYCEIAVKRLSQSVFDFSEEAAC